MTIHTATLPNLGSGTPVDPAPPQNVQWTFKSLLNGSSREMTVNGSVTPVSFSFTPSASEVWYINNLSFIIQSEQDQDNDEFGSIAALTNGLKFEVKSNGNTYELCNLKDNIDITQVFLDNSFPGDTNTKWFKQDGGRWFIGNLTLKPEITLDGATSDYIKAIVRDDLSSGLTSVTSSFRAWRIL